MLSIGEVLAMIFREYPHVGLGETLKDHLVSTGGRGRYEEVPRSSGEPWQFLFVHEGRKGATKFVGLATHTDPRKISFGVKHDNR